MNYDIIVIGAGPAGSMAANHAAILGRKVCLVERKDKPGYPTRCGEGVGYRGFNLTVDNPRPEWIKNTVSLSRMISPAGITVDVNNVGTGYILDREKMDADLADEAEKNGATFMRSTAVIDIKRDEAKKYICTTANNKTLTAPCVILADGVESFLARKLGWNTALDPRDIETCAIARVKSDAVDHERCIFYTGGAVAPGGYLWIFPRGAGEANVGLGINGSMCAPGLPKKLLFDFIAQKFPNAEVSGVHCGGVPVGKWTRPLVRGGAMLVGDAARQVSALSGAGIAYSLYAGKLAGETAAKSFNNDGTVNEKSLKKYHATWAKRFGRQVDRTFALKEFLLSADDNFLDDIAKSLSKEDPAKINYLRVFTRTFARHPLLRWKAFLVFR